MQRTPEEYKAAYLHHKNAGNAEKAARVAQLYRQQLAGNNGSYQSPLPSPYANQAAAPQAKDGAFGYSVDQAQRMAGKGIEAAGRAFNSKAIADYGTGVVKQQDQDIAIGRYTPSYTKSLRETYNQDGLGAAAGWLGEKTAENAASAGTALGGAALTAITAPASMPLAAILGGATTLGSAAMGAGEAAFEQEEKTGDYDAKLASGVGVLIGVLDKFGAGKVIPKDRLMKMTAEQISAELSKKGFGEAAKTVLKRTGAEALTENAQEGLSIASAAVRGGEYTLEELGDRALEAAALGGTTSLAAQGGMGTLGAATNLVRGSNTSAAPADQEAAASFAQRLAEIAEANGYDLQDIDKMSSQGARETVDKAHIQYTEDLKQLFADLKSRVAVTDQDSLEEVAQKVLAAAAYREGRNKTKSTVGVQEMSALESLTGDTREGQQALSVLRQLNQLTELHNSGYQGGVSAITDQFAPFGSEVGYDKGAVQAEKRIRGLLTAGGAVATGGGSLLGQVALQGTGRMIDKVTGRRSVVDNFVKQNQGQPGIPGSASPSLREASIAAEQAAAQEAEALQAQQEAQAQEEANLNEYVYNQGGLPNDKSPAGNMSSVLGIDPEQMMTMLDEIIATEPNPQIVDAAIAAQGSIVRGGFVPNLNQLISMMKLRVNPDPQFWIERDRSAGQAAAQDNLSRQEQNYQRGIENNQAFNQELQNAVDDDGSIPPLNKAYLKSALADLARDLGAQPLDMVNSIIERAVEKGVTQEQMQAYLAPYLERVQQQQDAKNSRDQAAAEVDADPINAARVVPVPFNNVGMQGAFGVDQPTPGGNFIDLDTKADLTGNTYAGGSVKIIDGKPLLETSDTSAAPATKESGNKVKVNLFKKKAGWSWVDYDGPDTIVSTEQGGKHHYSLSSDFQTPVTLQTYPKQPSEPRLRPTSQGKVVLGNKIGSISVRGKVHPVYDQVTIEDKRGVDPINENKTPVLQLGELDLGDMGSNPMRVSPSYPQGAKATLNPLEQNLQIGLNSVRNDPAVLTKIATKLREYTPLAENQEKDDNAFLEQAIESYKDNLLSLFDSVSPEYRDRAKLWYVGANKLAQEAADLYNLPIEAVSGVYASLSPQQDWYVNYDIGMRTIDIFVNHQDTVFDDGVYNDFTNWIHAKYPSGKNKGKFIRPEKSRNEMQADADSMLNKPFKDLSTVEQGFFVRFWDEANNEERGHRVVTPEGGFADFARKQDGEKTTKKWNSFGPIVKSLEILANPSRENIHVQLGEMHKVRSFYNNILDPYAAEGDVTIDTHAIAAALLRPLAGSHIEVKDNFGSAGASKNSGVFGSYGVFAEAYRRAASEAGVQPREMQSITWEAVRGLFPKTAKGAKQQAAIKGIWEQYKNGTLSAVDARKKVYETAGNIRPAQWEDNRPNFEAPAVERSTSDAGDVSSLRTSRGDGRGDRSNASRGIPQPPEEINPAIKPGTGILSGAVSDYFKQPTPAQIKEQVEPAEQITKFVLGKPGSEFENGISTYDDLVDLANMLDVSVEIVSASKLQDKNSMGQMQALLDGTAGEIKIQSVKKLGPLEFMKTLAHEVSHALEGLSLDRLRSESVYKYNAHPEARGSQDVMRDSSLRSRLNEVIELAFAKPGMFFQKRYDSTPSAEVSKKIVAEIDELQRGTMVGFADKPELGQQPMRETFPQFTRSTLEFNVPLPENASATQIAAREAEIAKMGSNGNVAEQIAKAFVDYHDYIKETAEFGVDPLHFYLMDPKGMKKMMPETFKFMRDIFNKSSMPIEMHANPMMTVIALLLAGFGKALSGAEEEERPQGVLNPQPALLTT